MTEFHLREHIRRVLAATPGEDLDTLVTAVFNATPVTAYADAYRQALAPIVRVALATAERPDLESVQLDQKPFDTQDVPIELGQDTDGEEAKHVPISNEPPPLPVGPNLRNSRAAIFRRNRFRVSVWVGPGTYRAILDCTRADLEYAATESRRNEEANRVTAEKYERLVKLLAERGAETVADLTDEEIQQALNGDGDE